MMSIKETILANPQIENAIDVLNSTVESNRFQYSKTIPIDNWNVKRSELLTALKEINFEQSELIFELGGDDFRPDLIITSQRLKAAYDAIPKTKTMRDVLKTVFNETGITTDIEFHIDLDKKITDEEFNNQVEAYRMMSQISFEDLEEDDSNE